MPVSGVDRSEPAQVEGNLAQLGHRRCPEGCEVGWCARPARTADVRQPRARAVHRLGTTTHYSPLRHRAARDDSRCAVPVAESQRPPNPRLPEGSILQETGLRWGPRSPQPWSPRRDQSERRFCAEDLRRDRDGAGHRSMPTTRAMPGSRRVEVSDDKQAPSSCRIVAGSVPILGACDPPRSGSTSTCRSARRAAATATSTPTRPRSWRDPARRRTAGSTRCARSWRWPGPWSGHGRSTPCSSAAGRRRCSAPRGSAEVLDAGPVDVRAGPGRGGDDREQPGVDLAGVLRRPRRGRVHPGLAGDAVGGPARPARAGAPAHAGPGGGGGAGGAGGGARARQPRPDLRARRGRPTTICARRWTPCWPPGWTTSRRTR